MSVRATHWAWETGRRLGVGGGELLVLLRLADHADNDGICWPGEKGISDYVGISARRVRDSLARLQERGLLERERRERDEGRGRLPDRILLQLDQPDVSSSRSRGTNRTSATPSTGRFGHDQPDVSDAPYIEEPSGTVKEPPPPSPPRGERARDRDQANAELNAWLAEKLPDVDPHLRLAAAQRVRLARVEVTPAAVRRQLESFPQYRAEREAA